MINKLQVDTKKWLAILAALSESCISISLALQGFKSSGVNKFCNNLGTNFFILIQSLSEPRMFNKILRVVCDIVDDQLSEGIASARFLSGSVFKGVLQQINNARYIL